MQLFFKKVRHIYLPFLIVAVGFVGTYSILAWALVYKTRMLALDEDLTTFWLPNALAWVPGLLWVWPPLKVLKLEGRASRMRELYLVVAVGTMIATTVFGQMYLSKASARITQLGEITEISGTPLTRYYRIDRPCFRRDGHQFNWSADRLGRNGETLRFTISVAVPFCGSAGSLQMDAPPAWLGITFSKTMHSALPEEEKERTARAFAKESQERFATTELGEFTYLELIGPGAKRRGFDAAIGKVDPVQRQHLVLEPHHEAFEVRTGKTGEWALGSFAIGAVLWLFMLAIPGVHRAKLRQLADGTKPSEAQGLRRRDFLILSRTKTFILAYLNVGVFLLMVFAGLGVVGFHLEDLVKWGACSRSLLHGTGILRLVTSQFVHGGLMHIASNIYGLLLAGLMVESFIGGRRLLLVYLVAGVIGDLASLLVHPATVTTGASGSILGLFGVLFGLVLAKDKRVAPARNFILVNAGIFVGLTLLVGVVRPDVDNAGHVGGLLAGFAMVPLLRFGNAARGRRSRQPAE